jgi:hypothetical protein
MSLVPQVAKDAVVFGSVHFGSRPKMVAVRQSFKVENFFGLDQIINYNNIS